MLAELPREVKVGVPVAASTSHGWPVAGSRKAAWQPGAGSPHQRTRGSCPGPRSRGGVAGKTAQLGLSESKSTRSSRTSTCPVLPST